jgi:preprotein translocase subunit SecG
MLQRRKIFLTPLLFIVLVPPLFVLVIMQYRSGGNGSGSGSSGGSGPSPSGSSSKRRHSKFVAGNAQVRF